MMTTTNTTDPTPQTCPGCNGAKVQTRADGIRIICPVCLGAGVWPPPPMQWTCTCDSDDGCVVFDGWYGPVSLN